jgi:hypothetical protein
MLVYTYSPNSSAGAVMAENPRRKRAAAAILFSLIMACLLGLGGLLAGSYVWSHFGTQANDPDDTASFLCGLLVGGVVAVGGGITSLWMFWPPALSKLSQTSGKVNGT